MNAENIRLFTQYQKQLQEAEKSYQKKVYALQEDVQKLNKAYQAKLVSLDKSFAQEEKNHAGQLQHIEQTFAKDSKTLTQDAIARQSQYQEDLKALKARWADQEKTIKTAFDKKLGNKADELKNVQKERDRVAREIEKEYEASKARLEKVKTVTTEIFEDARSTFQSSLSYYLKRLQTGAADDLSAYKKEISAMKKGIKTLEKKQTELKKSLFKATQENTSDHQKAISEYQKELGLMQSKAKAFITRSLKKFDSAFLKTEDDIKKTQTSFRGLRKRLFNIIEAQRVADFDLVNQYQALISNQTMQKVYSELQSIATNKNQTMTQIYTNLTDWADRILKESLHTNQSATQALQSTLSEYGDALHQFLAAGESTLNQISAYDQFEGPIDSLFLGHNIDALKESLDTLSEPLLNAQKKWHQILLKSYKESQVIYKELDEIQAFFDSFDEEKALAFENEQVHITRRAAQLDVEVETAKKQYEYDSLMADQTFLFEKNKTDHLIKEYKRQEKQAIAQAKADFAVKDLTLKKVIAKAKNDFQLKKAFYDIEAAGLTDKKNYRLADIQEAYAVKRFDVEKKKAYALYELKLTQNTELDQHAVAVNDAKNLHQRNQENKQFYQQELENKYGAIRQAKILALKKEIDEAELEIKRLKLAEENEIRTLTSVYEDEVSLPNNRLKEFDKAIGKRLKSINTPYQARLKTFQSIEEEMAKANPDLNKVLKLASPKFKDDLLGTMDIYYETLKWTREYYADLELSKIKRSDMTTKKQGQAVDAHQEGERKYLNNLHTYAKASEQSITAVFAQMQQQLKKKDETKKADLVRTLRQYWTKLYKLLEEQTQLTTTEIESLFQYIKEQDEAFIEDVNEGLNSAKAKIKADYQVQIKALMETIDEIHRDIDQLKDATLVTPDEDETLKLQALEDEQSKSQQMFNDLDFEKQRKQERFKSEIQSLENEFSQQLENVEYQHQMAIENVENEIQNDQERINEKRLYAEKTFERIQAAQKVQSDHDKNVLDTAKAEAQAKTQKKIQAREDKLAEIERIKERKMINIESKLNTTLDDIQSEISSREIQLEAAKEKVERQYDSLYFDYQNRAQVLNEKLLRLQKYLFSERENILSQLKDNVLAVPEKLTQTFEKTLALNDMGIAFKAHSDQIDQWIDNKKAAFKAQL